MDVAGCLRERVAGTRDFFFDDSLVRVPGRAHRRGVRAHDVSRDAAVNGRIGDPVAAETVGAVSAAGVFPSHVKAGQFSPRIGIANHAAHEVMGRRHNLDAAGREVEPAVRASLDHATEPFPHFRRAEMAHGDIDTAVGRGVSLAHLAVDSTADDVPRRAFAAFGIVEHEPLSVAAEKIATGAAKAFLEDSPRHPGPFAAQQTGGVELHHFHIPERQSDPEGHGQPVHALVT